MNKIIFAPNTNQVFLHKFNAPQKRRLFEGGASLKTVTDNFTLSIFFYSTVHVLSVNFPMDWYLTDNKSRITREIHAVKKIWEFHDNKSKNNCSESIGGAALIRGRRWLTFLSQMGRLFKGGAYSSKYGNYFKLSFI